MPPRKAPPKPTPSKERAQKSAATKAPARKAAVKKAPASKGPAAKPASKKPAQQAPSAKGKKVVARRPPGSPPIQKTRVVVPMDFYEPNKDAIKAPFKKHELKWNFLGEGKGLYKRADGGVHCFTQFKDDGLHYSIWGDDKKAVGDVLSTWRALLGEARWSQASASGEEAAAAELKEKESEAVQLWKLGEPQRRPGEPELFFQKRIAEWQSKRPA